MMWNKKRGASARGAPSVPGKLDGSAVSSIDILHFFPRMLQPIFSGGLGATGGLRAEDFVSISQLCAVYL